MLLMVHARTISDLPAPDTTDLAGRCACDCTLRKFSECRVVNERRLGTADRRAARREVCWARRRAGRGVTYRRIDRRPTALLETVTETNSSYTLTDGGILDWH